MFKAFGSRSLCDASDRYWETLSPLAGEVKPTRKHSRPFATPHGRSAKLIAIRQPAAPAAYLNQELNTGG